MGELYNYVPLQANLFKYLFEYFTPVKKLFLQVHFKL